MRAGRGLRAIIVGGGIGGLTTAIALRQAGVEATIFERADALREVGAGLSVWSNATRVLHALGLAEQLRAIGSRGEWFEHRSLRGETLARWQVGELCRAIGAPMYGVRRQDLVHMLAGAIDDGVVRVGARCVGFTQDATGVTARFADGREERADLLIGADGLHSAIRAQLLGPAAPRYAGYTAWRGIVEREEPLLPAGVIRMSYGRGARFLFYRVGQERSYWLAFANARQGEADSSGGRKAAVLARFAGWHDPIGAVIAATDEAAIIRSDIVDRLPVDRWGEGQVTLLGDAAHPATPNLGQGACQAIEDAAILARCLRENADVVAALRSYEQQRMGRTAALTQQARRLGALGRLENPLVCAGRDQVMRQALNRFVFTQYKANLSFAA